MRVSNNAIIAIAVAVLASANGADAQTFKKQGFSVIQHDGWIRNAVPDGDVYTCAKCKHQVQVQISFGEPLSRQIGEAEFLGMLDTEEKQKDFAKSIIQKAIPMKDGYSIDVYRTGMTEIGGLKVARFAAAVEIGRVLSHDVSMVGLHNNRIVRISLNYFGGTMSPDISAAINELYGNLKFE